MANVKNAKKELLQDCGKFLAVLEKKPKLNESIEIVDVVSLNRNISKNLQDILKNGNLKDKEEAMIAYSRVVTTFGNLAKKFSEGLGAPFKALAPSLTPPPGKEVFKPEVLQMFRELTEKLEKLAKKPNLKK